MANGAPGEVLLRAEDALREALLAAGTPCAPLSWSMFESWLEQRERDPAKRQAMDQHLLLDKAMVLRLVGESTSPDRQQLQAWLRSEAGWTHAVWLTGQVEP